MHRFLLNSQILSYSTEKRDPVYKGLLTYDFAAETVVAAVLTQDILELFRLLKRLQSRNFVASHVEDCCLRSWGAQSRTRRFDKKTQLL